jgi:predicted nucleic acid-binding protein
VTIVLDGSVALAWSLEDERTPATIQVLDAVVQGGAVVPSLWRLEVANALQMAVRRRRIEPWRRDALLANFATLNVAVDPETDGRAWGDTLRLADRFGLTLYDAAYLELAQRRSLPLATLDSELRAAASTLGVTLTGI